MMIAVALDGPAGAGKSSIAKELAKRFSLIHVDTGALYRAVGLYMLRQGLDPADEAQVVPRLPEVRVTLKFTPEGQRIFLGEEDVSEAIRTPEASRASSAVSAIPQVRAFLLELQRKLARENPVIMDGRDIGTVVLPEAPVKIFLTAAPEARAMRRYKELAAKGVATDYDTVLAEVKERDYRDSHRQTAPLRQAEDAVLADTTKLDFQGSVELLASIIEEKLNQAR